MRLDQGSLDMLEGRVPAWDMMDQDIAEVEN